MCDTFSLGGGAARTGGAGGADRGMRQRGEKGSRGHREELQLADGAAALLPAAERPPVPLRRTQPFNQPLRAEGRRRLRHPLAQGYQTGSCRGGEGQGQISKSEGGASR